MPTLVYFGIQGRAQPTRFALAAAEVEYENKTLTQEEWGAAKAEGTYGVGAQLPVWIKDDGKIMNQSIAILKYVCAVNGLVPDTPEGKYENDWYFDARDDQMKSLGAKIGPILF